MKRDDMKAAAKFRAVCECGKKQPRFTTAAFAEYWMNDHEREHRRPAVGTPPKGENE